MNDSTTCPLLLSIVGLGNFKSWIEWFAAMDLLTTPFSIGLIAFGVAGLSHSVLPALLLILMSLAWIVVPYYLFWRRARSH